MSYHDIERDGVRYILEWHDGGVSITEACDVGDDCEDMHETYDYTAAAIPDREELERLALDAVSAADYYDLADTVGETSDDDLRRIINGEERAQ